MNATTQPSQPHENSSDDSLYTSFVSGAKFGMIVAVLTLLVSRFLA